jgi:hypothetical protein
MIETLRFFQDRLDLAGPDGAMIHRARAADRTTAVIRKYIDVNSALKDARQATISHCEAIEGKGGVVSLRVADRPGFEALQSHIRAKSEELALEAAISELDKLAAGAELWYSDLEDMVGSYGRVEFGENARLSNLAGNILQRKARQGIPADEILEADQDYQHMLKVTKEQIDIANKQLATLRPKLDEMKRLLEGVGC